LPFEIVRFSSIDSTSSEAFRRLEAGARAPFVIVADQQSAGRGTHGRNWISPPGNLYASIVTFPGVSVGRAGELAFVAGVAARETLCRFLDPGTIRLKWPNDLVVADAKIGGILTETTLERECIAACVAGIGINVASAPLNAAYPVTSIADHGTPATRDEVFDVLLAQFDAMHSLWLQDGFEPIRRRWTESAWRLNENISFETGGVTATGRFEGINEYGSAVLHTHSGLQHYSSGRMNYLSEIGRNRAELKRNERTL
jgi:BirA family biotin operon repressor/biotin-[acetyl-CoA-carboxylase] ligase